MVKSTCIYFIGNVELGAVKIGMSSDPTNRLAELQRSHPHKLSLYRVVDNVTQDYETELHKILTHIRKEGEWFELTDELIHFMINRIDETSSNYKIKKPNKKNRNNLLDIKNIKNSNSLGHSYQEWTFLIRNYF